MNRMFFMLLAIIASAGFGYWFALGQPVDLRIGLPRQPAGPFGSELSCISVAYSSLFEEIDEVLAYAGPSTDRLALKIDEDSNTLRMVTTAGVKAGNTTAAVHTIVMKSDALIVAASVEGLGHAHTFQYQPTTGRLMWTKNAYVLGLSGQAIMFQCR